MASLQQESKSIAILGFAVPCTMHNKYMAFETGKLLAKSGYVVTAGNLTSTFYYAFKGAKSVMGNTVAIIEKDIRFENLEYCDVVERVNSASIKHTRIADTCTGAIVIGGGSRTNKVVNNFLQQDKPVIAIKNTGGIVDSELDTRVQCIDGDVVEQVNAKTTMHAYSVVNPSENCFPDIRYGAERILNNFIHQSKSVIDIKHSCGFAASDIDIQMRCINTHDGSLNSYL